MVDGESLDWEIGVPDERTIAGRKVYAITQQWDAGDALAHTSFTLHDANDFSTVLHETWWERLDCSTKFDFIAKQVEFKGTIDDSAKAKIVEDFNQSFGNYNLCWPSDLEEEDQTPGGYRYKLKIGM